MSKINISDLNIYRWRYLVGYGLVAIGLIAILIFAGLYSPGGLSYHETQSVIKSGLIKYNDFSSLITSNLPYYMMQNTSLAIFGVSILSIKIPSIILAFLSAIGLILLLKNWFKPSVGILASLIAISTGQFIFIAQEGTPNITCLFWSVWLILIASIISQQKKLRKLMIVIFAVLAILSLYTPLSIYLLIALASAAIIHPHLRFLVKQIPKKEIVIGIIIAVILLIPLILAIIKTPSLGMTLLGIPTGWPNFGANLASLGAQYFGFANPGGSTLMTPFFELGSMLIIALGVYDVIKNHVTGKNYIVIFWSIFLIPVVILNSNQTSITFLPLVLLLASGLNRLIGSWYELFPRNPYARIGGLIPLIILTSVLVFSGTDRYIFGYRYDPNIAPNFSHDINLIPSETKNLVVTDNELDFYNVIASYNKDLIVSTKQTTDTFLATRGAKQQFKGYNIAKIITTSNFDRGDRFYLYTKSSQ
ncbi:MAG: hypothetical protein PWQ10_394 [Patescibacteria group bacterium]|nr:hypothetical protein [Patescibacteria group bacterium]